MEASATWRRAAAAVMPAVVPALMVPVFRYTVRRFGKRRGYQAGFGAYWALCWGLALAVAGRRRLVDLWRVPGPAPQGRLVMWSILLVPPAGAIATELIPNARKAGPTAALAAVGIGLTNALAEEALWRGVPLAVFPGRKILGWLWPSLGFTAWHLVPLAVRPHPRGRWPVLLGAGLIGVGYGWAAQRSGSLLYVSLAHAATDSCGVRAARNAWLPQAPAGQK
ncbi:CPBP family intramembrane glutamic endopeptidase [Arthrobacter sp. B1I2]|uniref:CPBP family intramembrane glutamic endopeptidase n=1 Tax=Arthrobacter sp. B1I2 TaxID=3042263 RepID=UPI00277E6712|nr:CPBP family intramembrane glutamic endopeptidase [Arthrobacter sp. B1I2]MDQ0733039.1 membrane protease YdiL (CAAX protease family) [Arthrobacter sp. B1I2]